LRLLLTIASYQNPAFGTLEPCLLSPYNSTALAGLTLGLPIIGFKGKLPVLLLPAPIRCRCGGIVDIRGDHLFSCARDSKTNLQGHFHHSSYFTLFHQAALLAQLDSTSANVTYESSSLVLQFPDIRPADVTIRLQPRALPLPSPRFHDHSHFHFPHPSLATSNDHFLVSVVQYHKFVAIPPTDLSCTVYPSG
jgi:hypothetical protein